VGKESTAGQATDGNMAHAICVLDTNTHSEYVMEIMWENIVEPDRPQTAIWRIDIACWIQTHTQNIEWLLFSHSNNGCTNAPHCYVTRTSPVLF
jgi:hypothetical protein